jgi:hypothetical protein
MPSERMSRNNECFFYSSIRLPEFPLESEIYVHIAI